MKQKILYIAKGNFKFDEWEYIENKLIKLLDKLKKENYLHKNRSNLVKFMILY